MKQIAAAIILVFLFCDSASAQFAPPPPPPPPQDSPAMASPAAPSSMQEPELVTTTGFRDGTLFATMFPYVWTIGRTREQITIPEGFVTDFASIPSDLQGLLRTQGSYSRAAVLHDFLYWSQQCTREQSDNLFLIAMIESGVPYLTRATIYRGVRAGGAIAWSANARERSAGLGRFVPTKYRHLMIRLAWDSLRLELMRLGARDPVLNAQPAVCALGNYTTVP